jgi:hypothetical protein
MHQDIDALIDVLHAIKVERGWGASGEAAQRRIDRLVCILVASTRGAPTVNVEIARRIVQAHDNYDHASGKTFCGIMKSADDLQP